MTKKYLGHSHSRPIEHIFFNGSIQFIPTIQSNSDTVTAVSLTAAKDIFSLFGDVLHSKTSVSS